MPAAPQQCRSLFSQMAAGPPNLQSMGDSSQCLTGEAKQNATEISPFYATLFHTMVTKHWTAKSAILGEKKKNRSCKMCCLANWSFKAANDHIRQMLPMCKVHAAKHPEPICAPFCWYKPPAFFWLSQGPNHFQRNQSVNLLHQVSHPQSIPGEEWGVVPSNLHFSLRLGSYCLLADPLMYCLFLHYFKAQAQAQSVTFFGKLVRPRRVRQPPAMFKQSICPTMACAFAVHKRTTLVQCKIWS